MQLLLAVCLQYFTGKTEAQAFPQEFTEAQN